MAKDAGRDDEADADKLLDASDLIAVFSDGKDSDSNGYTDDIAGWDFFDDDNDPYDASSYSSAENHGSGRAKEAAGATNNGQGDTGVCPRCQVVPLRIWDTFVADTTNLAQATLYAADNRIEVVESAIGGLSNPRFAREAFRVAYRKGVFFAVVSSDLNTANHNIPTVYDEAMQVQGVVPDTEGLGSSDAAEVGSFLGRDRDSHRGAGPDVVPQLRDDPVRRARAHRHARHDGLAGDRAGGGRRRAGRSPTRATRGSSWRPTRSSRSSR